MNPADFQLHFLRPWWWLALLPLLPAWLALARAGSGRAALARLADAALLPHLVREPGGRRRFALMLFALAWVLAVAALSGPAWRKAPVPLYVNGAARVVALSLSDDMLAQDMPPDRMARARFAVRDLLDDAGDARTALVAYAGAAFTVAPLTDDKRTVLNLLAALRPDVMPEPGNDAAAGIEKGMAVLRQSHVKGGEIVLVTDAADDAAVAAARAARADGIRVDVLGIGTTQGAPVPQVDGGFASGSHGVLMARRDDAALRAVARAGGGRYVVLDKAGDVAAFGKPVAANGNFGSAERAQLWRDGGIGLLPALLLLGALAFRRGWLLALVVLVLPIGVPVARASTWDSLWSNRDQRALQALVRGDAPRARKLATTPGMRGAADYRAGDYADAAKAFARGGDARSRYNLGNALARQGHYEKAIAAYRQALKLDPGFADARANLDAVEDWLKGHPSPQRQGRRGDGKSGRGQPASSPDSGSAGANDDQRSSTQSESSRHPSAAGKRAPTPNAAHAAHEPGAQSRDSVAGAKSPGHGGASLGGTDRRRQQARQAAHALSRELQAEAQSARPGAAKSGTHAFALGQNPPRQDGKFDARQRAMLLAVPDDPGALLRRKFRLEWDRRHAQGQEDSRQ
jgi:Ca-activated chloride channel family protein